MKRTRRELELLIAGGRATPEDITDSGISADDVVAIKLALPFRSHAPTYRPADVELENEDGTFRALDEPDIVNLRATLIAATAMVARDGDIIVLDPGEAEQMGGKGLVTHHFDAAGSPYLWMHDQYVGAVGKVESHRLQRIKAKMPDGKTTRTWAWLIDVRFFNDDSSPYAKPAWLLTLNGLRASSFGWITRGYVRPDEDQRVKLGLAPWGVLITTAEALEVSKVIIPADPWALGAESGREWRTFEGQARQVLADGVERKVLTARQVDEFLRKAPLSPAEAATRLTAKVRATVPMMGRECTGLECLGATESSEGVQRAFREALATPDAGTRPETPARADCGCGARTLQEQLATIRSERDELQRRLRVAEGDPQTLAWGLVNRAMAAAAEASELLALAVDGAEDDVTDGRTARPGLVPEVAGATITLDLRGLAKLDAPQLALLERVLMVLRPGGATRLQPGSEGGSDPVRDAADRAHLTQIARGLESVEADLRG